MVQTVVSLRCEVREERSQPIPHREPVGVAESPMAEIDGRGISAIRTRIDLMLLERGGQSAHAGGTARHPGRRRAGGGRGEGNTPIGRGAGRGREESSGGAGSFKKKKKKTCGAAFRTIKSI